MQKNYFISFSNMFLSKFQLPFIPYRCLNSTVALVKIGHEFNFGSKFSPFSLKFQYTKITD